MKIRDCEGIVWVKRDDGLFEQQGAVKTHPVTLHYLQSEFGPIKEAIG